MKRLTDTKKWDVWFRKLSPSYKSLWDYLYDHCGPGGVWDRDDDVARLFVNDAALDLDNFLVKANEGKERMKVLKDGRKWFIVDFVHVQCPTGLKRYTKNGEVNRVHAPIYLELEKYGVDYKNYELNEIRASTEPLERLLDIEQDKEKDKEGIVKGGFSPPCLEDCVALFREKGYSSAEAEKFWNHYEARGWMMGKNRMKKWKSAVVTWVAQGKQFGTLQKEPSLKKDDSKTLDEWRKDAVPMPEESRRTLEKFGIKSAV